MADTQEFLDEVLGIFMGEIGLTRSRVEHGYIKPAEAYTENEKTKGKVQQAILQHFQQEQERNPEIERFHKKVDELIELYGGDIVVMSQKDWDRNLSNNYVLKSEVDRLIRGARISELKDLVRKHTRIHAEQITDNEGAVYLDDSLRYISLYETKERIAELESLSKQKEGSK